MSNAHFPNADLQIRPASFSDIIYIQDIANQTWPVAYGEILGGEQLRYMLDRFYSTEALKQQMKDNHHFSLALLNFQPIGFASFSHEESTVYKLQKLYVIPNVQKVGAGKKLLEHVKTVARSMGGTVLKLNVNRNNNARLFYERNGFTISSTEDIDIGHGYFMNDYIMGTTLTGEGGSND